MAVNNIGEEITAIAKKYAALVKAEIAVESIYLFGSFVNDNYDHDSDIDIAVIADEFSDDIIEYTLKLMKIRRKVDTRIEPHPLGKDDPLVIFSPEIRDTSMVGKSPNPVFKILNGQI